MWHFKEAFFLEWNLSLLRETSTKHDVNEFFIQQIPIRSINTQKTLFFPIIFMLCLFLSTHNFSFFIWSLSQHVECRYFYLFQNSNSNVLITISPSPPVLSSKHNFHLLFLHIYLYLWNVRFDRFLGSTHRERLFNKLYLKWFEIDETLLSEREKLDSIITKPRLHSMFCCCRQTTFVLRHTFLMYTQLTLELVDLI